MSSLRWLQAYSLGLVSLLGAACTASQGDGDDDSPGGPGLPERPQQDWVGENTIALRHQLPVPNPGALLDANALVAQLQVYDPGSLIRCAVHDDPAYRNVIDMLGGVSWSYPVRFLEDESKPEFRLGPARYDYPTEADDGDSAGGEVEIEKADIVGLSDSAALYYSSTHGLMWIDLSQPTPAFKCAAKLPGNVRDFYYYQGHLVAMVEANLLHFKMSDAGLTFVERVALDGPVLDTRRFNDRLVVYSSLARAAVTTPVAKRSGAIAKDQAFDDGPYSPPNPDRALRVFRFGEALTEELRHTLVDTTKDDSYFQNGDLAEDTAPPGTVVYTGTSYGDALSASDRYFVVTESDQKTVLTSWETRTYNICVQSHTEPRTYQSCTTTYETRPNPAYTPPDNSGGDRACKGTTLSECLRGVARVSNKTIEVPVRTVCEPATYDEWFCDAYESRSYRYPTFTHDLNTRLTIFEYTDQGFVRLDSKVNAITTPGLEELSLEDSVDVLTTSDESFDLSLPGALQTVYFQDGFMYAVSDGRLQVYAMGDSSLVRTSELQVSTGWLQSTLFSNDKLYLSDYSYASYQRSDFSTLRVIDLSNPAFPRQVSDDLRLPGGHNSILSTSQGILTVGSVQNFEGVNGTWLKLGLFADPVTTEKAYLILGTDLQYNSLGPVESLYFDRGASRMFLPYTGLELDDTALYRSRVGVSLVKDGEIVSQGALHLPERIERVRPRPGSTEQVLAFGASSVAWLTPGAKEWQATPVLAYYSPIALYRVSEHDDYVEVLQLGSSCKLRFVQQAQINQRGPELESDAFPCGSNGWGWAYGSNIVFSETTGVRFDAEHTVVRLSADEIAFLTERRTERPVCMYNEQPVEGVLDPNDLPPVEGLRCYTRAEYQAIVDRGL